MKSLEQDCTFFYTPSVPKPTGPWFLRLSLD